jgi:hypothetical protein
MVELEAKQLKDKPKKIGDLKGEPVYQVETKGGLFVVMAKNSTGRPRTLGVGPHPATARHIAERDNPDLSISELSKSEPLDLSILQQQVRECLWLTRRIQEAAIDLDRKK